jgi:hypothetical protein
MKLLLRLFLTFAVCALGFVHAADERSLSVQPGKGDKRIALVIGNDDYTHVDRLEKAANDARAMGKALQQSQFTTTVVVNASRAQMNKVINQFVDDVSGGGIGVFFFAGHGVQVNNQNFLIPVDVQGIQREADIADQSVSLQGLQDKLADAKAKFSLLVIDACRNNPLPKKVGRALGGTRGLSQASSAEGQMVVFSAGTNQQALDKLSPGDANPNGVFTREFLPWLSKPGVTIRDAVLGVRSSVRARAKSVDHEQFPAIYDQAEGNFYFVEGNQTTQVASLTPQIVGARTPAQIEDELWDAIKDGVKASVFEEYIKQYPRGRYLARARVKLAGLKADISKPAVMISTIPAKNYDPETQFWNEVKTSGGREYLDAYLKQYPKGKYVALARIELGKIDDRDRGERARTEAEAQQAAQREEGELWNKAEAANDSASVQTYLDLYPAGRFVILAQAALKKVQREAEAREKLEATQLKLGAFGATIPGQKEIDCRNGYWKSRPPDGDTFSEFIRKTLLDELKANNAYSANASTTLTGNLDAIEFSSVNGEWNLTLTVKSSNGKSLTISEKYRYETSFMAYEACNLSQQALIPAVKSLATKVVSSPNFPSLIAR